MTAPTFPLYSPRVKTSNDVTVYYNLGIGVTKKIAVFYPNGVGAKESSFKCCGGDCDCPTSSWTAIVTQNKNGSNFGTSVPPNSPLFSAMKGTITSNGPTADNDIVTEVCLPGTEGDVLICFDQGAVPKPGIPFKPIPVKYNAVDHYVRQRSENTITLNDLFVCNKVGLQAISGIPVTIIIRIAPEGVGIYQEIQYYCNVLLSPSPMSSGSDGNASIDISMDGPFSFCAIFHAPAPAVTYAPTP